jgi:hypothetical protein
MTELIIPLPNGGSLRCGEGESSLWGGYVSICDSQGNEILYWEASEWEENGEAVMGAIFAASLKPIEVLTADRKLVDGFWVFDKTKQQTGSFLTKQ